MKKKMCIYYLDHNPVWDGQTFVCSKCGLEFIPKQTLAQQRTELLEEITDILDNIDTGMYVDDEWVSNSEELTELRKNINLLNNKDE